MTRKALRKRLRTQAKQTSRAQSSRATVALDDRRRPDGFRRVYDRATRDGLCGRAPDSRRRRIPKPAAAGRPYARQVARVSRSPPSITLTSGSRSPVVPSDGLLSLGAFPNPGSSQDPPARRFDIPPGPLADVLNRFEDVTGVRVTLAMEAIGTIQSPGVTGLFSIERALEAVLAGTNVTFRLTSPNAAVLELRGQAESVEVTGRAPTVVVSSPKYTAPLREITQTIEVIPRAVIEEQGVTTLSDALRNVPGITLQAGEGGGASNTAGDMFNMRGFNAANSLFVDGVRDDGLISRDVFNLEQIEVFMGPTGSDVGRGTAAGYVNMQTKSPLQDFRRVRPLLLRHRRAEAAHVRRQSRASTRGAGTVAQPVGVAAERALAGRRYAGPGLRHAGASRVCPVARAWPGHSNARDVLGSGDAPGQPARLRHPRCRLGGAVDADHGSRAGARGVEQLLRQRRLRLRQGQSGQLHRTRGARRQPVSDIAEPDPVQPRRARSRHHDDSECRRVRSADEQRDARPPGKRSREHHRRQPDDRRRQVRDRAPAARFELWPGVASRRSRMRR